VLLFPCSEIGLDATKGQDKLSLLNIYWRGITFRHMNDSNKRSIDCGLYLGLRVSSHTHFINSTRDP
jgi:hypothetical protein